jgi:deoxyribose-phosphate aldolase
MPNTIPDDPVEKLYARLKAMAGGPDLAGQYLMLSIDHFRGLPESEITDSSDRTWDREAFAGSIDHTLLKAEADEDSVKQLCEEARQYGFASVCVPPCYVNLAAELLAGSPVAVCTVVGFPLGSTLTAAKVEETRLAIEAGATEIDMVLNVGKLKSKRYDYVEQDIRAVVDASRKHNREVIVKVILETALLTDEEKVIACILAANAKADFVKTSTGFAKAGATVEDVSLMKRVVGNRLRVKAAGGIRTYEDARAMMQHGASRIGASASVAIVSGAS